MMRKLLSVLLTVSLICTIFPAAFAAQMSDSFTLNYIASLFNYKGDELVSAVAKEFGNSNVGNITMSPGEIVTTPAFHAISSDVLSYVGINVLSSDPEIADGALSYVGPSPVSGTANSFLGMTITAKKPGTCIITMTYDTFVTKAGVNDKRGNTGYAKAFNVTVTEDSLKMSVAPSANGFVWSYSPEYLRAKESYQQLSQEIGRDAGQNLIKNSATTIATSATGLGLILLGGALGIAAAPAVIVAGAVLTATVGIATNVTLDSYFKNTPDLNDTLPILTDYFNANVNISKDTINSSIQSAPADLIPADIAKNIGSAFKAVDDVGKFPGSMSPLQDMLDAGLKSVRDLHDLDKITQARNNPIPVYSPNPLTIKIRLTNNTPKTYTNVKLNVTSSNLSLTSENGPFNDSKVISVPSIAPWSSVDVELDLKEEIKVYPKKNYAHPNGHNISEPLYNGSVTVHCTYTDSASQETKQCSGNVSIPVYSYLTEEDAKIIVEAGSAYPQLRTTYVMCPVDVEVLDINGEVVALLTTDGESQVIGDLVLNVNGDAKFISMPLDQADDYSLRITAVDSGEMTVLGMDTGHTTNFASYDVSIQKGDSFDVSLNEDLPAALYSVLGEEKTAVEPTAVLNESVILEALDTTDASEGAKADIAEALARGLVPLQAAGAYQDVLTWEVFCYLLINFYEKHLDLLPGTLLSDYKKQNLIPQGANEAIFTAASLGLVDEALIDKSLDENADHLTPTTSEAFGDLLYLAIMAGGSFFVDTFPDDYDLPLTREQAICAINQIWNYALADAYNKEKVPEILESALAEMQKIRVEEFPYLSYYRDGETQKTLMRNFALYAPSEKQLSFGSDTKETSLSNISVLIEYEKLIAEYIIEPNIPNATPIDYKTLNKNSDLTLTTSSIGWSSFVGNDLATYHYMPLYYANKDGSIYQNTVYLAIVKVLPFEDTAEMQSLNLTSAGPNSLYFAIIADQDVVGEFLAQSTQNAMNAFLAPALPALKLNDEGDNVKALQTLLTEAGFMNAEVTGVYDEVTAAAVQAYQKSIGVKATGTADEATQLMLNDYFSPHDAVMLNWLVKHLAKLRGDEEPIVNVHITMSCNVRQQPSTSSQLVGTVSGNDIVTLIDMDTDGWCHILLPDGREGYVVSSVCEIIN